MTKSYDEILEYIVEHIRTGCEQTIMREAEPVQILKAVLRVQGVNLDTITGEMRHMEGEVSIGVVDLESVTYDGEALNYKWKPPFELRYIKLDIKIDSED